MTASVPERAIAAVVTVVSGRHDHLRVQRRALAAAQPPPDLHIVVSMQDDGVAGVLAEQPTLPTTEVTVSVPTDGLPLAAARNAGAECALAAGADVIVMLDVDCLPGPDLIARYRTAATGAGRGGLLAGPVTYLPPTPAGGWTPEQLQAAGPPHAARPVPADGDLVPGEHRLFWSLSFAVHASTWRQIGGFHPGYVGYGGEDTDFAFTAQRAAVPLLWVGGALAYHQHHPVSHPPVEHLDDILRNGELFRQRWGRWPMEGWMADFHELGLVRPTATGWTRARPIRLATVPAHHPYVEAVRPAAATPVRPERVDGWAPDPLLEPDCLRSMRPELDVVHLHFGYDHLAAEQLDAWLATVRSCRLPLVVTVHDLRNPHHRDPVLHDRHLRLLLATADEVITLTADAAAEIRHRYDREARVLAHPTLHTGAASAPTERGLGVLHLKSLRTNVLDAADLVTAAARGARLAGGCLRVDAHSDVADGARFRPIRRAVEAAGAELCVHERFSDDELADYLSRAHASVLPYRFGTHSGWLELCRDLGTRVVAPSCGYYAGAGGQWPDVVAYTNDERVGLDPASLTEAVRRALSEPPPPPADRARRVAQRGNIRREHELVYRGLLAS